MNLSESRATFMEVYSSIRKQAPPHHFEFHDPFWVLITTIMSHRTKDEVTDAAARGLFQKYHDAAGLAGAKYEDVLAIISRVGFSRVKAARVIEAARIIVDDFHGKVPASLEELTRIPGVGRKTANVVLADAFGKPAIAVDTHVFRIAARIGWAPGETPEETEKRLMKIVPKDMWVGFNPTMVEFGKKICRPVGPRCSECLINSICEYGKKKLKKR